MKYLQGLLSIILFLNVLGSPFHILDIKEKLTLEIHKNEFQKKIVEIDSSYVSRLEASHRPGKSAKLYTLLYGRNRRIFLVDPSNVVFHSKKELLRTKHALEYLKTHNDSLLIWHHPDIQGQYAKQEETELNTDGFILQIIINFLLLCLAAYSLFWQIREWRKPKK